MSTLLATRALHDDLADEVRWLRRLSPEGIPPDRWDHLRSGLLAHLEVEDRLLLPRFDGFAERVAPNQAPRVVRADHALLRSLLAELPPEPLPRALHLARLADVLEHHDRREAAGMLAVLDAEPDSGSLAAALSAAAPRPLPPPTLRRSAPVPLPGDPLLAVLVAAATDQDPPADRLVTPDHPKGPALIARVAQAAADALTDDLVARRDALARALDAARLLTLASPATRRTTATGTPAPAPPATRRS